MSRRIRSVCFLIAACTAAFGGTLVVPNANASTPGGGSLGNPQTTGTRFQEIVGGGQFPGAMVITGLRVRAAVGTGSYSLSAPSLKVTLSTTQAYPNTTNGHTLPSLTYANNVGPDATVVYNAAVSWSSPGCTGSAPCPFDMAIQFTTPFSFDPTKGRLLVDLVVSATTGTPSGTLDAVTFTDSTSSTVASLGGDPTQPAANTLNLGGFIFGLDTTTPLISGIMSAASLIAPPLPNSAIVPGSYFVVEGSGLGPATISIASSIQATTLSNTSVSVTVGSTTVNALMYYTSDGAVAALLPSNTPTGNGTLTLIYNNQKSASTSVGVVANSFGIFTSDATGSGPAIVTYPDYSLVSPSKAANCGGPYTTCGAANPGDTLFIWGTGLGKVNGDDASGAGIGQNMTSIPLKLWVGGVQANVSFQGRVLVGEDLIAFTVPDNVPTGCGVPILVEITTNVTTISNNPVIPIAAKGNRTCTFTDPAVATLSASQITGTIPVGLIELDHFSNDSGTAFSDQAQFNFLTFTVPASLQLFAASYIDNPPIGTCTTSSGNSDAVIQNVTLLDAGSSFTIKGPKGSMTVTANPGDKPSLSANGGFLVPGDYTITGAGGKDVGPFSVTVTIQPYPTLTSPASANNLTVSRSKGMTITWNPNGSTGHVEMQLASNTSNGATATVACTAPASAGTFTIPEYMLYTLPTGSVTGFRFQPGDGPGGPASSAHFSATGIAAGVAQTFIDGMQFVGFTITN